MDPEEVSKLQAGLLQATGSSDYPGDWPDNGNKVFHNMCRRFPEAEASTIVKIMAAQGYNGGKVAAQLTAQLKNEQARQSMDPDEKATLLKLISEATGECDFPSDWPFDKAKSILDRLRTEYSDVSPAEIVKIMIAQGYNDVKVAAQLENAKARQSMDPEEKATLLKLISEATGECDFPSDWPFDKAKSMLDRFRTEYSDVSPAEIVKIMIAQGYNDVKVAAQLEKPMDPDEKATFLKLVFEATGECDLPADWPFDKAKSILNRLRKEYSDVSPAEIVKIMIAENCDDTKRGPSPGKITTMVMKHSREQKAAQKAAEEKAKAAEEEAKLAALPDLNLSVYLLSGEKVWGPGAVSGSLFVIEFMTFFADAVGEPAYKLNLLHGEKVLPGQERLGHLAASCGMADAAQLTVMVADLATVSTSQLVSEGRRYVIKEMRRRDDLEDGESPYSVWTLSFYEWPQTSGLYWSWMSDDLRGRTDRGKIDGPFNKTYVDTQKDSIYLTWQNKTYLCLATR